MKQYRIGVLCFGMSGPTVSLLSKIAQADPQFVVKAYPIFGPGPEENVPFPYRVSRATAKTIFLNNISGTAPEKQIRNLGIGLARDLVRESDVICLLGLQGIPALLAAMMAILKKKPILLISQTMNSRSERNRPLIIRRLKKIVLGMSRWHVAQTPYTCETLVHNYGIPRSRMTYIAWDGGAEAFSGILKKYEGMSRNDMREETGLSKSAYVFLYSGTLFTLKGVDVLLRSFARVQNNASESILAIAGPDDDNRMTRARLEKLADSLNITYAVRFLGALSWQVLAQYYLSADVFVLPTRKDTWGKVLVEAGLAGLPLITTDVCGGAGILVQNNRNGYVIPVDDVDALAQAMMKLTDSQLRDRFGRESKLIMKEYLNSEQVGALYKRAIRSCVRKGYPSTEGRSSPST